MSEVAELVCLRCGVQLLEDAMFCHVCGQSVRCQKCSTLLSSATRFCHHCGNRIAENTSSGPFHSDVVVVPSGYNSFRLHEADDRRDLDLFLSDESVKNIKDVIPSFIDTRFSAKKREGSSTYQQTDQAEVVEVQTIQPQMTTVPITKLPAPTKPEQRIREVFREQEGKIIQVTSYLKADTKKDYTIRLICLYLYMRLMQGIEKVSRAEIYEFLQDASVKDRNVASYISREDGIRSDEDYLMLNQAGRNKSQQYLSEIFDTESIDGWYPGIEAKTQKSSSKKVGKRESEKKNKSNNQVEQWLTHPVTRELVTSTQTYYNALAAMPTLDKALFGLYALYKLDVEKEVQPMLLEQYLYAAFQLAVKADSARKAFVSAINKKLPYVTHKGTGYRITIAGVQYIEQLFQQKNLQATSQEEIARDGSRNDEN